jgi:fructokinase
MPTDTGPFRVAAFGEVLWDLLPDGARLGGAPANFIAMTAALGDEAFLVSGVGEDERGHQAIASMAARGVAVDCMFLDADHPTGTVTVKLDSKTGPEYCIHENAAWDFVAEAPGLLDMAASLDALCFGTLAQRCAVSRTTLRNFVGRTRGECLRVFDVNLRAPFWTPEAIAWGCSRASIVKMNHEEVVHVAEATGAPAQLRDPVDVARFLVGRFALRLVAITRGGHGSLLVTREDVHDHPGIPCEVVDAIGAGDAFTAALTHSSLRGSSLEEIADAANRWGAWVASQPGGMPRVDAEIRRRVAPRSR